MIGLAVVLLFLAGPWILVVGAVSLDERTGRGIGLGLCSLALLAALLDFAFTAVSRSSHVTSLGAAMLVAVVTPLVVALVYLAWAYLTLAVLSAGWTLALRARQPRWATALTVAALVAAAAVPIFAPTIGPVVTFTGVAALSPPIAIALAYSVWRTLRPARARAARQPAMVR